MPYAIRTYGIGSKDSEKMVLEDRKNGQEFKICSPTMLLFLWKYLMVKKGA